MGVHSKKEIREETAARHVLRRKWHKDLGRSQMLMELAPLFTATTLSLAANVDRATVYRNCTSVGSRRVDPPQTAELLLEGLDAARTKLVEANEWPEAVMPLAVIDALKFEMDLNALNHYLYALAGALRMRPLHLRMFALELAIACRSIRHWNETHMAPEE